MKSMNTFRSNALLFIFSYLVAGFPEAFPATMSETSARLPELIRTTQRQFAIPFRLPKPATPDAKAQQVEMSVSTDFGLTWTPAGSTSPPNSSIPFEANTDGEYWFSIRAIDQKNRARGGEGPDARVLVDAAAPRLSGRVWKGTDGEIVCRYAAASTRTRASGPSPPRALFFWSIARIRNQYSPSVFASNGIDEFGGEVEPAGVQVRPKSVETLISTCFALASGVAGLGSRNGIENCRWVVRISSGSLAEFSDIVAGKASGNPATR